MAFNQGTSSTGGFHQSTGHMGHDSHELTTQNEDALAQETERRSFDESITLHVTLVDRDDVALCLVPESKLAREIIFSQPANNLAFCFPQETGPPLLGVMTEANLTALRWGNLQSPIKPEHALLLLRYSRKIYSSGGANECDIPFLHRNTYVPKKHFQFLLPIPRGAVWIQCLEGMIRLAIHELEAGEAGDRTVIMHGDLLKIAGIPFRCMVRNHNQRNLDPSSMFLGVEVCETQKLVGSKGSDVAAILIPESAVAAQIVAKHKWEDTAFLARKSSGASSLVQLSELSNRSLRYELKGRHTLLCPAPLTQAVLLLRYSVRPYHLGSSSNATIIVPFEKEGVEGFYCTLYLNKDPNVPHELHLTKGTISLNDIHGASPGWHDLETGTYTKIGQKCLIKFGDAVFKYVGFDKGLKAWEDKQEKKAAAAKLVSDSGIESMEVDG